MKVQGRNGKFYDVNLKDGTCSCSGFTARGRCPHSGLALDIFKNGGQTFIHEIKQAFICEVRRNSPSAYNWGRLIYKARGADYFIKLCRMLLRTETRNLTALEKSYELTDPGAVLDLLVQSPKLHQNPYYIHSHQHLIDSFYKYQSVQYKKFRSPVAMLREFMDEAHDPESGYLICFFMEDNRELFNPFVRMLYDRATDDRNWDLIRYLELCDMYGPESWRYAVELLVRYWNPEAERTALGTIEKPELAVPRFEKYHALLKDLRPVFEQHHKKIRPNQKIALEAKVDLRYSDSWFGYFWRFLGMNQHGSIDQLEWSEVEFTVGDWLGAQVLDKRYYPSLYRNILLAG